MGRVIPLFRRMNDSFCFMLRLALVGFQVLALDGVGLPSIDLAGFENLTLDRVGFVCDFTTSLLMGWVCLGFHDLALDGMGLPGV